MNYSDKLHEAAKQFLLVYFSDGRERVPSDFDDEIIGGMDFDIFTLGKPRWNRTPFLKALGDLVDEGKIKYWMTEEDGFHHYQMA